MKPCVRGSTERDTTRVENSITENLKGHHRRPSGPLCSIPPATDSDDRGVGDSGEVPRLVRSFGGVFRAGKDKDQARLSDVLLPEMVHIVVRGPARSIPLFQGNPSR
ncbi:hypothetical protein PGT21_020274 [Puccinia graminis f. sp. tritici]|uniref:Uncharacterized protein n=1 Tax=Puccinia graminis f. sp. tritici TaxID=56615 RepID=A0A5B0N624_PUCGR|nr:hypothetical protein PGT21_020274 [Puccinia graminis f. sp. tritici]